MTQEQALNILKMGANVFLTGQPGSGKTYVTEKYINYLRSTGVEPAITASTGIAATHLNGQTIHAWSGIGIRDFLDPYTLDSLSSNENLVKRIKKTKVLIIDEVSMLSDSVLDMVDQVCRTIKMKPEPFGGLQVILVGDLFQLPPINSDASDMASGFVYQSKAWQELKPIICYLSEQHRQKDDNLLTILSAIRRQEFDANQLSQLKTRQISPEQMPTDAPKLFTHNVNVNQVNLEELNRLPGEAREFMAKTQGRANLIETLKRGCLSPEQLILKPGATVMFTKNDFSAGYVNGTLGQVIRFNSGDGLPVVKLNTGRKIKVEPTEWVIEDSGKIKARFNQIPLRLAWAITIHKSQGMSLDQAVIDLSKVFTYGQGYVALSRVRELSGLFLLGLNELATEVHPTILRVDIRWQKLSQRADEAFGRLDSKKINQMQNNFILTCGGQVNKKVVIKEKKSKLPPVDTLTKTFILWQAGKDLDQITKERNLKAETIIDHLEKLLKKRKIDQAELSRLLKGQLIKDLPKIRPVFEALGMEKLAPVYHQLNGEFDYLKLKIVRLILSR